EGESTEAGRRGGAARSSVEGPCNGAGAKGLRCSALATGQLETGGACGRGKAVQATVEHREPCDSRGSCTVLGAPGGEIPPGDARGNPSSSFGAQFAGYLTSSRATGIAQLPPSKKLCAISARAVCGTMRRA